MQTLKKVEGVPIKERTVYRHTANAIMQRKSFAALKYLFNSSKTITLDAALLQNNVIFPIETMLKVSPGNSTLTIRSKQKPNFSSVFDK